VTRSPFYHVALYDGDGYVVDAVPRGVVRRPALDGTTGTRFVVARAPEGRGEAALAWAKSLIGKRFDVLGMFAVLVTLVVPSLGLRCSSARRFTCSHLVAEAFRQAGIALVPEKESSLVVPGDLACLCTPEDVERAWRERWGS
jgi:hypothetical protein